MTARFTSLALVAALLATGATAPAFAQAPRAKVVNTSDLDLSTDAGVKQLNGRILRASAAVCGVSLARDLNEIAHAKKCRAESLARANGSVERLVMNARSGQRQAMATSTDIEIAR